MLNRYPRQIARSPRALDWCTEDVGGRAPFQTALKNSNALQNASSKTLGPWSQNSRQSRLWSQSSLQVEILKAARARFVVAAFETTYLRSPASPIDPCCMLHVLTGVCSRPALRLWSASQVLRPDATSSSWTLLSTALEQLVQLLLRSAGARCTFRVRGCWLVAAACCGMRAAATARRASVDLYST